MIMPGDWVAVKTAIGATLIERVSPSDVTFYRRMEALGYVLEVRQPEGIDRAARGHRFEPGNPFCQCGFKATDADLQRKHLDFISAQLSCPPGKYNINQGSGPPLLVDLKCSEMFHAIPVGDATCVCGLVSYKALYPRPRADP